MRKSVLPVVLVSIGLCSAVQGALIMTLQPEVEAAGFVLGQPVRVNIGISGLEPGTRLELLAGRVDFTPTVLGSPSTVLPGSIVASPTATPLDFLWFVNGGVADVSFQTNSPLPEFLISADGVFATIVLTPIALGAGQLSISFSDALAFNPADPGLPVEVPTTAGPAISFTVVIPEPSLVLVGFGGSMAMLTRRRKN